MPVLRHFVCRRGGLCNGRDDDLSEQTGELQEEILLENQSGEEESSGLDSIQLSDFLRF